MPIFGGVDAQKKAEPTEPTITSQVDDGLNRDYNNGAALIYFDPPAYDGKLQVIQYEVTGISEDGTHTVIATGASSPIQVTGLHSGVKYIYTAKASNVLYKGPKSKDRGAFLATTIPATPGSIVVTDDGNTGGVTLDFTVASEGGDSITEYTVVTEDGLEFPIFNKVAAINGLIPGNRYKFKIRAKNKNGFSRDSDFSTYVVPTRAPANQPQVTNYTFNAPYFVDNGSGTGGAIKWTGTGISSYRFSGASGYLPYPYEYNKDSQTWAGNAPNFSGQIVNLAPCTTYTGWTITVTFLNGVVQTLAVPTFTTKGCNTSVVKRDVQHITYTCCLGQTAILDSFAIDESNAVSRSINTACDDYHTMMQKTATFQQITLSHWDCISSVSNPGTTLTKIEEYARPGVAINCGRPWVPITGAVAPSNPIPGNPPVVVIPDEPKPFCNGTRVSDSSRTCTQLGLYDTGVTGCCGGQLPVEIAKDTFGNSIVPVPDPKPVEVPKTQTDPGVIYETTTVTKVTYQVKAGDTFNAIAAANGLTPAELKALNPTIADPNSKYKGGSVLWQGTTINLGTTTDTLIGYSASVDNPAPNNNGTTTYTNNNTGVKTTISNTTTVSAAPVVPVPAAAATLATDDIGIRNAIKNINASTGTTVTAPVTVSAAKLAQLEKLDSTPASVTVPPPSAPAPVTAAATASAPAKAPALVSACFAYETEILMANGTWRRMETLKIDDEVMAADIPNLPDAEYPWYTDFWSSEDISGVKKTTALVKAITRGSYTSYYVINDIIKVTGEHLMLVRKDGVWSFRQVVDIAIGDELLDENLEVVKVFENKRIDKEVNTVTIDTEVKDVYFVRGAAAHNRPLLKL